MSRGISVILLVVYLAYRTSEDRSSGQLPREALTTFTPIFARLASCFTPYPLPVFFQLFTHQHLYAEGPVDPDDPVVREGRPVWGLKNRRAFKEAKSARRPRQLEEAGDGEEEEEETPSLNKWVALALLVVVTVSFPFRPLQRRVLQAWYSRFACCRFLWP